MFRGHPEMTLSFFWGLGGGYPKDDEKWRGGGGGAERWRHLNLSPFFLLETKKLTFFCKNKTQKCQKFHSNFWEKMTDDVGGVAKDDERWHGGGGGKKIRVLRMTSFLDGPNQKINVIIITKTLSYPKICLKLDVWGSKKSSLSAVPYAP